MWIPTPEGHGSLAVAYEVLGGRPLDQEGQRCRAKTRATAPPHQWRPNGARASAGPEAPTTRMVPTRIRYVSPDGKPRKAKRPCCSRWAAQTQASRVSRRPPPWRGSPNQQRATAHIGPSGAPPDANSRWDAAEPTRPTGPPAAGRPTPRPALPLSTPTARVAQEPTETNDHT
jgi:hypothetical protein